MKKKIKKLLPRVYLPIIGLLVVCLPRSYTQTSLNDILDQYVILPASYENINVADSISNGGGCYNLEFTVIPELESLGHPNIMDEEYEDYRENMTMVMKLHYAGFTTFHGHPNDRIWLYDEWGNLVEKNVPYDNPFSAGEEVFFLNIRGDFDPFEVDAIYYSGYYDAVFELDDVLTYEANEIVGSVLDPYEVNLAPILFDIQGAVINTKVEDTTYNGGVCLEVGLVDCFSGAEITTDQFCYEIGETPLCNYPIYVNSPPTDVTICEGEDATMSVVTSGGNGNLSYQWRQFCDFTFTNYTQVDGLISNTTYKVKAFDGVIYAATNGGIAVTANEGADWTTYSVSTGLPNNSVNDVYVENGVIYAATNGGLAISSNNGLTWTNYGQFNGLGSNIAYAVHVSNGTVYVATTAGVAISQDGGTTWTSSNTTNGLGHNFVNDVYALDGKLYAGTYGGVSISEDDGLSWTNYDTDDDLASAYILAVYKNAGTLYAATSAGISLSVNDGISWTNYSTADGLGNDFVYDVTAVDGSIYVATYSGLSVSIDGGQTWTNYTTAEGLATNFTYGVYEDEGQLYIATFGGGISQATVYTNFPNSNSPSYSFTPTLPQDSMCIYQVVITDALGCSVTTPTITLTVEECTFLCPEDYEGMNQLTGIQDTDADYETSGGIDSDQQLTNTIRVDYDATTDIELLPGFEVQLGVEFDAFIDGCDEGGGGNQLDGNNSPNQ